MTTDRRHCKNLYILESGEGSGCLGLRHKIVLGDYYYESL